MTVSNGGTLTLHLGKPKIVVRPVGGATPGSLWVELPDQDVVFTGDVVTQSTHPFMSEANTTVWLERLAELRERITSRRRSCPDAAGATNARTRRRRLTT